MKMYILIRHGVPLGYALAAASHGTLGLNISFARVFHEQERRLA